jgi:hypothetical protein
MKRAFRQITIQSVTYLMLSLVALMVVNKALFIHVHKNNGQIITHAHPYDQTEDNSSNKTHHHTNAQYLFYGNLNTLFLAFFLVFFLLIHVISTPCKVYFPQHYTSGYILPSNGRDPPLA